MALADDLKSIVFQMRAIPGSLGLRPHAVAIVTETWSGEHTGEGTRTQVVTAITEADGQNPKVRWITDEEKAVGELADGTVEVGPITPSNGSVGTLLATLTQPNLATGATRYLRITGPSHPDGAKYRIKRVSSERALRYMVRAEPVTEAT